MTTPQGSDALDPAALLEETTPGPWHGVSGNVIIEVSRASAVAGSHADAALIAAAPDLASALIKAREALAVMKATMKTAMVPLDEAGATVATLMAERDEARAENERWRNWAQRGRFGEPPPAALSPKEDPDV